VVTALISLTIGTPAHASSGGIDPAHKYAFSNIAGYINFAPSNGGVVVSSTALTGYAWSANDGWINLSPAQGGVVNDGQGHLSGFAWDTSVGWVDFSGVVIDSNGLFHGLAIGGTVNGASYGINFDCSYCSVITAWRPPAGSTNTNTSSSAGAISPIYYPVSYSTSTPAQNSVGTTYPSIKGTSGTQAHSANTPSYTPYHAPTGNADTPTLPPNTELSTGGSAMVSAVTATSVPATNIIYPTQQQTVPSSTPVALSPDKSSTALAWLIGFGTIILIGLFLIIRHFF
jgi:hypothetical protein